MLAPAVYWHARADTDGSMKLDVSSPAFKQGDMIPVKYTCDGESVSPPLSWSQGPALAGSYALVMDDPDAPSGTFTHWVMFNIPANLPGLNEGVPPRERLADESVQGRNDYGNIGYGAPCPPRGTLHHYRFHVYALDTMLSIGPGSTKADLQRAMGGHILAEGELTGVYGR